MRPIKAILFEPPLPGDAEGTLRRRGASLRRNSKPWASSCTSPPTQPQTIYITDNAEGLAKAKAAGMIPILLMHDPDEAMRLVRRTIPPAAIVSLLELPDFIRFWYPCRYVSSSQPFTFRPVTCSRLFGLGVNGIP